MSEVFEVPEGWEIASLSDCSSITNSNVDKKYHDDEIEVKLCNYMDVYINEEVDKSIDFMTATATTLEIEKFELKQNDVIITKDSELPDDIAIPTYIKEDLENVLCGYHLTLLRPKMKCNGKFLAIVLQSSRYKKYFGALASGSTRFALSLGVISNTPILLPPLKEQQKIAKILSTLDRTIEASQKLIAKEKNIKKGLMHDLLTNGIDENGTIRSLKTHQYKESELGLIPEEWEIQTLKSILTFLKDGTHGTHQDVNNGIPMLSAKDIYNGKIDLNNEPRLISEEDYLQIHRNYSIQKNDILLTIVGTIGRVAIVKTIQKFTLQRSVAILRTNNKIIVEYLYYILTNQTFLNQLIVKTNASAQGGIYLGTLATAKVKYPKGMEEQQKIANILTAQDKKIKTEEKNLEKLKELKKGLMYDLLSGKVRVKV